MHFRRVCLVTCLTAAIGLAGCADDDLTGSSAGVQKTDFISPALLQRAVMPTSIPPGPATPRPSLADIVTLVANGDEGSTESESADQEGATVKRESVEIEPYTGPPIYLDEPEPPPPATVVESRRLVTQNYPDGGGVQIERQVTRYSDDRIVNDGTYREYHPNGQLFVQGTYDRGEQHGEWAYWYENGQKCRTVVYDRGMPTGSWDVFRADGSLLARRSFEAGRRNGQWVEFTEDGKTESRVSNYKDGKLHGEWKDWHPSGAMRAIVNFKNGVRDGISKEWDSEGTLRAEATYKDGKLHGKVTKWNTEGEEFVQHFQDGRLVSVD